MKIVIVSGLSGSGKSEAMNILEDMGFYCVDNLPPSLIQKFVEVMFQSQDSFDKVALGIDIRGYQFFKDLYQSLVYMKQTGYDYDILFLDADDSTLIRRYKMTRRKHPLSDEGNIYTGIQRERDLLSQLRETATHIINTTEKSPRDLREELIDIYAEKSGENIMNISLMSFGFKHGIPIDADMVFDVRFMPNPYYIDDLKDLTGDSKEVQDYVMDSPESKQFKKKLEEMVAFLIPQYIREGKGHLMIAIGCTGGRHRSVTMVNKLHDFLKQKGYSPTKKHRDYTLK
ncbi:MAG: RNase adapter RapZ [Peptostreptococcaceae bacterium]|nr:RNase adapter RapZ [Peptostreptococcaceae bacterium]